MRVVSQTNQMFGQKIYPTWKHNPFGKGEKREDVFLGKKPS